MLKAESVIAIALMGLSGYFMWHATVLPIGWNGRTGGPGGGAFPFWLSAVMLGCSAAILVRSLRAEVRMRGGDAATPEDGGEPFFDPETLRSVVAVTLALTATIALMPVIGTYLALPLFLLWYLKVFGGHRWAVTAPIVILTPIFLFFFFEVTLRILLPKGLTEPWFFPLYATFF